MSISDRSFEPTAPAAPPMNDSLSMLQASAMGIPRTVPAASPQPEIAALPILFLHIPKTAGTSLLLILENLFGNNRMTRLTMDMPGIDERVEALVRTQPHKFACINGHLPFRIFAPYMEHFRGFTLLRNPVARVLSLYRFLRQRKDPSAFNIAADTSLDAFLDDRTPNLFMQTNNGMCRMLCTDEPLTSGKAHELSTIDNASWVLDSALETLHRFDFGLVEQMEQTRNLVCRLWSLPFTPDDVAVNATDLTESPATSAHILRIVEMNALDIALYEHAVSLFRKRTQCGTPSIADPYGVVFRPELNVPTPVSDVPGRQGFHEYEPVGFAWLNSDVKARLHFHAPADSVRIVLHFYALTANLPFAATILRLNNRKLRHEVVQHDREWITLQSASVSLARGINVLAIEPPYFLPVRHVNHASSDDRYLSLALATITFLP